MHVQLASTYTCNRRGNGHYMIWHNYYDCIYCMKIIIIIICCNNYVTIYSIYCTCTVPSLSNLGKEHCQYKLLYLAGFPELHAWVKLQNISFCYGGLPLAWLSWCSSVYTQWSHGHCCKNAPKLRFNKFSMLINSTSTGIKIHHSVHAWTVYECHLCLGEHSYYNVHACTPSTKTL